MKRKSYSEAKIISILKEAEAGATFYAWKRKYGGMEVSEAKRLKAHEDENRRLKKLIAEQALDIDILKTVNEKNGEAFGSSRSRHVAPREVRGERPSCVSSRGPSACG